jgi:protein gp37
MRQAHRFSGPGGAYEGLTRLGARGPVWTGKVTTALDMLAVPLRWRKPAMVFVDSMSDLFHEKVHNEDILLIFQTMALAQRHTFQILTKRAERLPKWFRWFDEEHAGVLSRPWPLPNVWLGVSVEDRARLFRLDLLRQAPAAVRMVSFEPLLEDLRTLDLRGIDWAIVGGESGPGARPLHPDWVRRIRDQCLAAGTKFFFKQWGAWCEASAPPCHDARNSDETFFSVSGRRWTIRGGEDDRVYMQRVGKHAAGRLLDGRQWDDMPPRGMPDA